MKILSLTLMFLFSVICSAQVRAGDTQRPEREHLFNFSSDLAEPLDQFLLKVGSHLHDYTTKTGNEACGAIGQKDGFFSVMIYTDEVPHGCAVYTNSLLEGYRWSGETIHSHPRHNLLKMTSKARAWSRFYKDGNDGTPTLRNDGADGFSQRDIASGPGWLVAKGQLLHQSGPRTVTRHGSVVNDK
jgi:hypothetical protein